MKTLNIIIGLGFCLSLTGCGLCSKQSNADISWADASDNYEISDYSYSYDETPSADNSSIKIAYSEMDGNTITIPVKINGMGLDMIFDTGASSTCITLAEANYLHEKGKLSENDIIDFQHFQTADGQISVGLRINLRKVEIGDKIILHNIEALVVENQRAPLLLGQSVMKKFREISVDRVNGVIKFFE